MRRMFEGRKLVISTKHQKEQVLGPILERALGVQAFVPENLDTDQLGTFSGEVPRLDDPLTTARKKCLLAIELTGCDLSISSEGSFGSHPSAFFLPANEEWLIFLDQKNQVEIFARHLSTDTNFGGQEFRSLEELQKFARKSLFPSHGLILRPGPEQSEELFKGITDPQLLEEKAHYLLKKYGSAYAETDMRAFLNPSRMNVIRQTAEKLVEKILLECPACHMPGFSVTQVDSGLPCEWCGWPTRSILAHHLTCAHCDYRQKLSNPSGKSFEDPMYCDRCNP